MWNKECKMKCGLLACVCLLGTLLSSPALAVPPSTINIHGQLVDGHGHALTGDRNYRVRFFNASTGGAQLGGNLLGSVALSAEGLFNIVVSLPPEVIASAAAWYEIAVDSDPAPNGIDTNDVFPDRVAVQSVPFAVQSRTAVHVEAPAVGNGTVSNTELDALHGVTGPLQTQLGAKANAADVYTKAQVDAAQTAQDTATDTALAAKANTADVYTKTQVDASQATQNTTIAGKADASSVYTKTQVDASQSTQDTTIAGKVAKVGDTMTGPLNVNNGFVGLGQTAAPNPAVDRLYNVLGNLFWNGSQISRYADTYTKASVDASEAAQNATIAGKADTANVYTKAQVDATQASQDTTIAGKADASNVYTKAQVDAKQTAQDTATSTALAIKANTADVYTKAQVDATQASQNTTIAGKADSANVYTKAQIDTAQSTQDTTIAGKVAKAGDTMTGALNVNGSYIGLGQAAAPSPITDRLYNVGGTAFFAGTQLGYPWIVVAGTSQQAVPNHGYVMNNAAMATVTLPASASLNTGDTVRVNGLGAGGWKVAQNANQKVLLDSLRIQNYPATWTPRDSNRNWYGVASSADGTKLLACHNNGFLYTSIDSGLSWTPRNSSRTWYGVASSADGIRLVAGVWDGQLYTSDDSGLTWTPRDSARSWSDVASSADGAKLVAVARDDLIYTSTDFGHNWVPRDSARQWYRVASSADGTKLIACVSNGLIYTSTDSGANWTPRDNTRGWRDVASSADGTKLVAVVRGCLIYTSPDSGESWTPRESSRLWDSVASSADGTNLVANVDGGRIYTSTDAGVSWMPCESNRGWFGLASSADGTKLVAGAKDDRIYTCDATATGFLSQTTAGGTGYLSGGQRCAVELQYVGSDMFVPLSHEGSLGAF